MSAYAKTLDKSRHHGSIHPPHDGAFFEQDGLYFDHEGQLVDSLLTDAQKAKLKKKSEVKKPKTSESAPSPEAAPAETAGDNAGEGDDGDKPEGEHEDGLNLSAWLKGDADYPTRDVQNAIKARYAKNCTKIVDMVEFLLEQGIATKDELKQDFKKIIGEA